jgi:hypothetical protein
MRPLPFDCLPRVGPSLHPESNQGWFRPD